MKKLIAMLALMLAGSAHAQVYFGAGSDKPINPGAATVVVPRGMQTQPRGKVKQAVVRCRDGSRRTVRVCKGHGGVAKR
jgi:hypothetical protein